MIDTKHGAKSGSVVFFNGLLVKGMVDVNVNVSTAASLVANP